MQYDRGEAVVIFLSRAGHRVLGGKDKQSVLEAYKRRIVNTIPQDRKTKITDIGRTFIQIRFGR